MDDGLLKFAVWAAAALLKALLLALIFGFIYRQARKTRPVRTGGADVFTYSSRTRRVLAVLGLISLVMALGPALAISYKYLGPEPCGTPGVRCRYAPLSDTLAGIGLFAGFGLGAIICFFDPRIYYLKMDRSGVTVRGVFSGVRSARWAEIKAVEDFPSWQMAALKVEQGAKRFRLWIPQTVGGYMDILHRLMERGLVFAELEKEIAPLRLFLEQEGYEQAQPYRLFLPFLTLWRLEPGREQFGALLLGVMPDEQNTALALHIASATTLSGVLAEVKRALEHGELPFHPAYQRDMAKDMEGLAEKS